MNIKNENGVTLVALVVTIIVMVILASIAISASVGDDSIIKQTEGAVIEASEREVEEAIEVKLLLKEKENIKNGSFEEVTIKDLRSDGTVNELESEKTIGSKIYNIYIIDISKLDIKGDYGKGSDTDVFKVKVELDTTSKKETKNFEVVYVP